MYDTLFISLSCGNTTARFSNSAQTQLLFAGLGNWPQFPIQRMRWTTSLFNLLCTCAVDWDIRAAYIQKQILANASYVLTPTTRVTVNKQSTILWHRAAWHSSTKDVQTSLRTATPDDEARQFYDTITVPVAVRVIITLTDAATRPNPCISSWWYPNVLAMSPLAHNRTPHTHPVILRYLPSPKGDVMFRIYRRGESVTFRKQLSWQPVRGRDWRDRGVSRVLTPSVQDPIQDNSQ